MAIKAFPTAEGYGAEECVHGRGGTVKFVTNLNDSGAGSLREALTASGARYVIFTIGGAITLNSNLIIANPYIYIAGQTAPGGGILLKNYGLVVSTHDVVVRFIRGRCGHGAVSIPPGRDTINFLVYGGGSAAKYNIIFDHCDSSWATDQNGPDVYTRAYNITFQWCTMGEGMVTGHVDQPSFPHNMGNILGAEPWMGSAPSGTPNEILTVSQHHCIFHSCLDRSPLVSPYPRRQNGQTSSPVMIVDFRNNLISNWGGNNPSKFTRQFYSQGDYEASVAQIGAGNPFVQVNMIGNLYLAGPNTEGNVVAAWVYPEVKLFARNNIGPVDPGVPKDGFAISVNRINSRYIGDTISPNSSNYGSYDPVATGNLAPSEFDVPAVETLDVSEVHSILLANAGCIKPQRDAVLERWITEIQAHTGDGTINHSDYPTLAAGTAPTDSNGDGIPDAWTSANMGGASANDVSSNGYTWIENYLNELAGDGIPLGDGGGGSGSAYPNIFVSPSYTGQQNSNILIDDGVITDEQNDALTLIVTANKLTASMTATPSGTGSVIVVT